jgi:hypothetical protein
MHGNELSIIVRVGLGLSFTQRSVPVSRREGRQGIDPKCPGRSLRLDNLAGWSDGLIFFGVYPCALTGGCDVSRGR